MGVAYYKAGRISKAEEYLESISKKNKQSPVGSPSFFTAAIYAAMGNNRAALEYLEKAYLENEVEMYWLKVEPLFNLLHDEPNWRKLLDKMNYPK
jgi:tetratricopeptide (TPR) repeat protein